MQHVAAQIVELIDGAAQVMEHRDPADSRLRQMREPLIAEIHALATPAIDTVKTRHHGNLQLSKVLLVADDFVITNFDGVLTLPLEERRRKHSPLRDVAAVLCSLRRAQTVAERRTLNVQPDLRDHIQPALETWRKGASDAFMKGYRRGVGDSGCVPPKAAEVNRLLRLYQIEFMLRRLSEDLERRRNSASDSFDDLLAVLQQT